MQRTVKKIVDGDTFVVNRKIGNTNVVRLAGYNAPEKWQFGGQKATNELRALIGNKTVSLIPKAMSYGRIVAEVRVNRTNISKRLGGR